MSEYLRKTVANYTIGDPHMTKKLTITILAFVACSMACAHVDARSLRDIGGAIVYPGKKVVKNANHNAKHVAGDPRRHRHGHVYKSRRHRH